jgi:beta-galactosidase/beta-glucuronidase
MSRPRASAPLVAAGHGYPRPQIVREGWLNLNGPWSFSIDEDARYRHPGEVEWRGIIHVPFSPETAASGIRNPGCYRAVWCRRSFHVPPVSRGERLLLHFGAVDNVATVWVNGVVVGTHVGGYTPFFCDITDALRPGEQDVVVRAAAEAAAHHASARHEGGPEGERGVDEGVELGAAHVEQVSQRTVRCIQK